MGCENLETCVQARYGAKVPFMAAACLCPVVYAHVRRLAGEERSRSMVAGRPGRPGIGGGADCMPAIERENREPAGGQWGLWMEMGRVDPSGS